YAPDEDMPGSERWLSYSANRTAHARIFEHSGAARPWLVCIHGYRMGTPITDLKVFDPEYFHQKLGLNVACPVLPLHGPRKKGLISGEGFLEGDIMDFIHAELQAQWDIRRLLSWLRLVKHAPAIGAYGVSLGGYNTALLSALDQDLACAVAGIPVVDIASTNWRHFPRPELELLARHGIDEERMRRALAVVSPLNFTTHLPPEKLGIFAGSIDTLVWPDHPIQLQKHWDGARINWYEGSHLSFSGEAAVTETLRTTLQAGGLLDSGKA
ncbi:MAG: alpha/beta hydrolase family protein, partial [Oceanococcus sp.]